VLTLILAGRSNKEIAAALNRSKRTVETHRAHVMEKLGVDSLVDLVKLSAKMGLVDLPADRGDPENPCASPVD
ncbi:MAG: LuxR C-terminal-related transcriptional regulator, partial [Planctomycetota bacterium]